MATRQSNGFFVVQSRHEGEKKNNRTQQGECHSLRVCVRLCASASQGEKEILSFVYKENYGCVASISLA